MSILKADEITAATTNSTLTLTGAGTGKLRLGDANLQWPDADGSSSGDVLQTNASGVLSFATPAGGGAWTMIGTQVASNSATLTQTGLDSTYDTYAIGLSDIIPATDQQACFLLVGDSSGIDTGSTDYSYHVGRMRAQYSTYDATNSTGNSQIYLVDQVGNNTGEGLGAMLFLVRPGDGTAVPMITGTVMIVDYLGMNRGGTLCATRTAVITLDRIQIKFGSGNITSGRMTVWGISHA